MLSGATMTVAMLCPMYTDFNTSDVIMTHKLGSTVVFTRYSNCISSEDNEYAEGSWRVARATLGEKNFSDRIVADYGFHEKGLITGSTIKWTNGAVWKSEPYPSYYTKNGIVDVISTSNDTDQYDLQLDGESIGTMYAVCDELFMNSRRGIVKGDFVSWDDGELWWPASQPSFFLDEYESYNDYEDYDNYEDYEDTYGEDSYDRPSGSVESGPFAAYRARRLKEKKKITQDLGEEDQHDA